ncbi:restriction endonuclease subunit S [Pseudomaricurvus alkylphenolicus]|uniref:restriction endonuclease subunit S n=1 Tax=Pseudomaricurvus alkylphenolicus TaxID=1306991 RepID=UPI00141EEC66|nr:restriction endonuclease subunit S [Pseudomaricurvus alkylphenolicus]NIB39087.1 restriction endonuclease subunit S [Pseudomaricurvus alkylphenolicus]
MNFSFSAPDSWTFVKLSSLGEVNRGRSRHRPRDAAHLYGGPYPFIQTGDVKASNGRITSHTQTYSEAGLAQSRLWPEGTMCITIAANIAETGILQFPACFPDSVIGFIPDPEKCDIHFIEYMFRLMKKRIQAQATGSVQDNINLQTLERIEFPIPSLKEQRNIAEVLCRLDDKIQLNHQINQTLEQMAQAIFKSWFVDFEPVKAKIAALEAGGSAADAELAAVRVISGRGADQLAQMAAEQSEQYTELQATAALFPAAMQSSELGEIPERWETSTVGAEFDVTMGQSPPGDTYNEDGEGIAFFQGRRDFGVRFPSNRVYCTAPKRMANEGDTLLSVRAPVGDVNIAASNCCVGRGLAALRHKSGCESFTYYSVLELGHQLASFDSEGTVFGSINQKNLKALDLPKPPSSLIERFSAIAGNLDGEVRTLSQQINTLSYLRDSLLPKLLSGELTSPEEKPQLQDVANV